MGRTCLLTGATGFLGKYLHEGLKSEYNIYTLSRRDLPSSYNFRFDLNDSNLDFNQKTFDLVVHAAGHAHIVPKSSIENKQFHKVNVEGTQNLLSKLSPKTPKNFVFISSVSVYGLMEGENINESAPLYASDPYGLSKINAENLVGEWCKKNNVICTIIRLPLIVGKDAPGNLGRMIASIKNGRYARLGKGAARKSMVLAEDVPKAVLASLQNGGIYNLTDGQHPSFADLENEIAFALGKKRVKSIPLLPLIIAASVGHFLEIITGKRLPVNKAVLKKITSTLTFSSEKARREIHWEPTPVLNELSRIVN